MEFPSINNYKLGLFLRKRKSGGYYCASIEIAENVQGNTLNAQCCIRNYKELYVR